MMILRYLYVFTLIFFLSGCALLNLKTNETDLSKKWTISVCGKDIKVTPQSNPILLYQNMIRCIEYHQYNHAVMLFSLAGTYSYFDFYRMSQGVNAHFHNRLLKNAMQLLDQEQKNIFEAHLNRILTNELSLTKICSQVKKIGMPMYIQNYMNANQVFDIDIDSTKNWENALQGYLHCRM